jgi:hypothetical protein
VDSVQNTASTTIGLIYTLITTSRNGELAQQFGTQARTRHLA